MVKKIAFSIAIVLAIALAWWLQQPGNPLREQILLGLEDTPVAAPARPVALVEVARAEARTVQDQVQAVGSLTSRQSVSLRAQTSGQVTQINFRDGARVRKSQLLIQQDDKLQRAQWQQANAELGLARANFQRNKELVAQGFISQQGLDESSAALQVQQARLSLAQTEVERLQIRAPFDAMIGISSVNVGDYLREGDEVAILQDMDVMYVDFNLPERYLTQIKLGMAIQFEVDALQGQVFTAQIIAIDPLIDEDGRSVAVRASLPNEAHLLRPGMFARIQLVLAERQNAVVVPEQALSPTEGGMQVVKLVQSPKEQGSATEGADAAEAAWIAELQMVPLGTRLPGWVEVRSGLSVGDIVVVAGQQRINANGQHVQVLETSESMNSVVLQGQANTGIAPAVRGDRP